MSSSWTRIVPQLHTCKGFRSRERTTICERQSCHSKAQAQPKPSSLNSARRTFTAVHVRGIAQNSVRGWAGDRPFLISGADDKVVKVWDYQTKACVQTLEGHTHNVSAVCFHPELPIILSGSEDGTLRLWHAMTYRLENTLNYGMERLWALGYVKGSNRSAFELRSSLSSLASHVSHGNMLSLYIFG